MLFALVWVTFACIRPLAGQNIDVSPKEVVVLSGDNATILCRVAYQINSCRIRVGRQTYILTPQSSASFSNVEYHGAGFNVGECGALIKVIDVTMHGNVTCFMPPQTGFIELEGNMKLVIALPPENPTLEVSGGSLGPFSFKEGDALTAKCEARSGRPAASLTWFFDGDRVTSGLTEPAITVVEGTDLETVSQNHTRWLTVNHAGKSLVCQADNRALAAPKSASIQLDVQYPPKSDIYEPVTISGLWIGRQALLTLSVRSNPKPEAEWTISDITVVSGFSDSTGKFIATEPTNLGSGYYNLSLIINPLRQEDANRVYYCRVSNAHGSLDLVIRIDANVESKGLELDAASIVGLVETVLVVFISVAMVVYAKVTKKWCFYEYARDATSIVSASYQQNQWALQ